MESLNKQELVNLIRSVFPRFDQDRVLSVLTDFPKSREEDNSDWVERRKIAHRWVTTLREAKEELQLERIDWVGYANVGSNNADFPPMAYFLEEDLPEDVDGLERVGKSVPTEEVLRKTQLFLAPTEYSTTAPLKLAAKKTAFRAATMAGFSAKMIPALRLDYTEINRRVNLVKERLDRADSSEMVFLVDQDKTYTIFFDLRFREAHTSSGRFPNLGTAGNLPSGETYIVPYEGEKGERSLTRGQLPVQFGEEVVVYAIEENLIVAVDGEGESAQKERQLVASEPAYANVSELGFGVLADFGIQPIGEILLDEKLGLHIAFGRSDHLGGVVGSSRFSSPKSVIHIDRIYIPATQPRVQVKSVLLNLKSGGKEEIMRDGKYLIF